MATEAGSAFTLGLHDLFKDVNKSNASKSNGRRRVAYQKVIDHVRDYVVARRMDFVPQVFLGALVKDDGIEGVSASPQSPPSWDRVSQLIDGGRPLEITTRGRKTRYKLNENLEVQVKVPPPG